MVFMEMKDLLEGMIQAIVDKPDEVSLNLTESENTVIYELAKQHLNSITVQHNISTYATGTFEHLIKSP